MEQKRGTFVVTHADEASAILQGADDGQVHALQGNPDLAPGDVIEATVEPVPPTDAAWKVVEIDERRDVTVERSDERPTKQEREAAADQPVGELTRIERAGAGELHVITVPAGGVEDAVEDVLDDEAGLVSRAASLGVERVVVRAGEQRDEDGPHGVVSVRYLP